MRASLLGDGHGEAVAAAMNGLDQAPARALVADRAPRRGDRARQHRFRHRLAGPERVEELAFRDHSIAGAQQVEQHIEDLRLDLDEPSRTAQLEARIVELAVREGEDHPARVTPAVKPWVGQEPV